MGSVCNERNLLDLHASVQYLWGAVALPWLVNSVNSVGLKILNKHPRDSHQFSHQRARAVRQSFRDFFSLLVTSTVRRAAQWLRLLAPTDGQMAGSARMHSAVLLAF